MAEEEAANVEADVDVESGDAAEETPAEEAPTTEEPSTEKEETKEDGESKYALMSMGAISIRLVQLTFAVISFGVMASATNFNDFPSFNLIVATGVIVSAWCILAIMTELMYNIVPWSKGFTMIEILMDYILAFLAFGTFCAAGAIQSQVNGTPLSIGDASRIIAAIFFMVFTWVAMCILPVMSAWPEWSKYFEETAEAGTALSQTLAGKKTEEEE